MSTIDTDKFRTILQDLERDLRHQLEELGANPDSDSLEGGSFDPGFADSAHSTAERGKVLVLVERLRDQLADVRTALKRLDEGTYGTCSVCGDPIPAERLEALPYSSLCVSCKQKSA